MIAFVLHSHLPWLAHHGAWPVGEEWLYQSWAASYLRMAEMLDRLADEGRTDQLTLGVTPVLAAQLDDPYCLEAMHHYLGNWQLRAHEAALSGRAAAAELGAREHRNAAHALDLFETRWRHGGTPVLRRLADAGTVELLGGPLAHPFQPLLHPRLRELALREGLAYGAARLGSPARTGIWAPECAYKPGMEEEYEAAGVTHFMVDGPTLGGDTALARPVGESSVLAFGRDLPVSYRVWSPKSGYPGHASYRDFYAHDHATGLKPSRVTGKNVAEADKAPYDPARADAAIDKHVADFVDTVVRRLRSESARIGRDALVVAAFDTELFGHWWYEGPIWLERVLRALPEAGVDVGTLRSAAEAGYVGEAREIPASSWGSGKDWHVWDGPQVREFVELNEEVTTTVLRVLDKRAGRVRDVVSDQVLQEALMCLQSDWPFMVSKDTAADYARDRAYKHAHALREIAEAAERGDEARAVALARTWRLADDPFPGLDARRLPPARLDPVGGL
ncbi:glycoside hydrolase family 57 protein [Tsukamurella sputi]|uniref:Glycoside hydrolase family 57 protein n=1 Tax=Tsukamurella sputi TaxID=2591848 RepID=A0A5C5RW63_9ACTN|nr:glycoside hydrolase family 57 protein [Tsukamurella sputi]TWS26680.1 glycoside hydrolase family 57 protein [Tsukamurella sputi]